MTSDNVRVCISSGGPQYRDVVAEIETPGGEVVIDQDAADGVYHIAFLSDAYIRSCPKIEGYPPWRMPLDEFLKAVSVGVERLRALGPKNSAPARDA